MKISMNWAALGLIAVLVGESSCGTSRADPVWQVKAANVLVENSAGAADQPSGVSLEDTLSEISPLLKPLLVGTWKVTNLGQNKGGTVTFNSDGTYTIDSGYFEAGGSWWNAVGTAPAKGTYTVRGDIIGFLYDGWSAKNPTIPVSRFGLVIRKRPKEISLSVQGHSHGVEILEKM